MQEVEKKERPVIAARERGGQWEILTRFSHRKIVASRLPFTFHRSWPGKI